tara:strand:- start:684 stop:962 length:279 start_codon:yes stop_codon:yes gene_type:complete
MKDQLHNIEYRKIEKDVPISTRPYAPYAKIAKKMEIDDSILFKTHSEAASMVNAIRLRYGKCINGKATVKAFACRMQKENGKLLGYRVWRTA